MSLFWLLGLVLFPACAPRGVPVARPCGDDADLVLVYGAEHRGSIGPCACAGEPRGGLPRFAGLVQGVRAANPDISVLALHAGGFLEDAIGPGGTLRPDVPLMNRWMVRALRAGGWSAIQAGYADLPGLADLGGEAGGLPLVSPQVRPPPDMPPVARWIRLEAGGHSVGVTGITGLGPSLAPAPGWTVADPEPALGTVLAEMDAAGVEIVVLLVFEAVDEAREAVRVHPEVDVVLDAARHVETGGVFPVDDALWARVPHETRRAGELRLWLDGGRVVRGLDRTVSLDAHVPADPVLEALRVEAEREIAAREYEIWGR